MSLELLECWHELLGQLGDVGDALCRAVEHEDVVAAISAMIEGRRIRAAIARVEAPVKLRGDRAELAAMERVTTQVVRARTAEAAMARWLARELPGDAALLGSPLGVAVLTDAMLPAVWDVETDVAVLVGDGFANVVALLADLGQRRIVVVGASPVAGTIAAADADEVTAAVRTMSPLPPTRMVVRAAVGTDREFAERVQQGVRAAMSDLRVHANTVRAFSRTWIDQGAANLPALARWPSIAALDGRFADKPMVIVAPGPSLARNVAQLAALRGRAIITVFSHSLKPVLAAGVVPDLVITVDPQDVRYHFAGCDVSKLCLVNAATAHPSLFELGAGRCLTLSANSAIDDWIFSGIGEDAVAAGGGSVATSAFSLALRWGCDPIVFVGLDLSFAGGQYYVASSHDGDARAVVGDDGKVRVEGWSSGFRAMKAHGGPGAPAERAIELPGWHGGHVPSSFMFSMFHRWFEERMKRVGDVRVFNCTEGGAAIAGMDHRPLAEVTPMLGERFDVTETLDDAAVSIDYVARRDGLSRHLHSYLRALRRARHYARRANVLSRREPLTAEDEAKLARTERQLVAALRPLAFVSLIAQREIERAFDVAQRPADAKTYLRASTALFETLLGVIDQLEVVVHAAAKRVDGGVTRRQHGRAA